MKYILIDSKDIDKCSGKGFVATWNEERKRPMVFVCDATKEAFPSNETITIGGEQKIKTQS